jgi:hypothetical protein
LVGEWRVMFPVRELPGVLESVIPLAAALCAWPVPRGKRNRFVEEEQLRVPIRGHHDPVPSAEFQTHVIQRLLL